MSELTGLARSTINPGEVFGAELDDSKPKPEGQTPPAEVIDSRHQTPPTAVWPTLFAYKN